jgi:hypothetical protein
MPARPDLRNDNLSALWKIKASTFNTLDADSHDIAPGPVVTRLLLTGFAG